MEIRELARAVLLSDRMADKLLVPDGLTDRAPGDALLHPPSAPARPTRLRLDSGRVRAQFPGPGQLKNPNARGRALHFFANHELLAMELMALVLLRFPNAAPGFRRGVAHTLLEEQDHLRRYRARMETLGVALGDVPVSDFFWSTMANMQTPLDYVVRMSMTFEQANLDHARHYAQLFRAVEDVETADLMDIVYEEELGHVQHGVTWFNRWRPEGDESDWQAYCRLLPAPMSARRAKGHPYVYAARRAVGLSTTFADELEIYSASRGRPPVLWIFEPDFEAQFDRKKPSASEALYPGHAPRLAASSTATTTRGSKTERSFKPPPLSGPFANIDSDLAPVMMFLAASDDAVVTPTRPRTSTLVALSRAGFHIPELIEAQRSALLSACERPLSGIEGWGESDTIARLRAHRGLPERASVSRRIISKIWAAEQLADLARNVPEWAPLMGPTIVGVACTDKASVDAAAARCSAAGHDQIIVKRPFSTSGQARLRMPSGARAAAAERWLSKALAAGPVLVEPWLDRQADISVLLDVTDRDADDPPHVRVTAMPFLTGRQGVYRGHLLTDPTFGLPQAFHAKIGYGASGGFAGRLAALGAFVRHRLAQQGHRGPAAIDVLAYAPPGARDASDWAIRPIVEINVRRTMGHVAAALRAHLAPGHIGVWLHRPVRPGDVGRVAGWPAIETRSAGRRIQLSRGLLATTDPAQARQVWSFLAVAKNVEDLRALLAAHVDDAAQGALAHLS